MHARPLLSHAQPTRNRQRQPNTLDKQRRRAQKPLHHKPSNDALHLANAAARRIRRKALDQPRRRGTKHAGKHNVHDVTQRPEPPTPPLPLGTPAVRAPAAERLVEVERPTAVPQLDVAEPLGHDVQKRSVQPDRRAHKRHHDPRLARVVRLGDFGSPHASAAAQKHGAVCARARAAPECAFVAPRFATQLFARGILHPVDGGEVLVALYFGDFFNDDVVRVRGICGFGVGGGIVRGERVRGAAAAVERGCGCEGGCAGWLGVGGGLARTGVRG